MSKIKPQFLSELLLTPVGDGEWWIVEANLHYYSVVLGRLVTVEAGFRTNLASIPRLFWGIWPPQSIAAEAVVHDWLYGGNIPGVTRAQADAVLLEAMKVKHRNILQRDIIYRAVRLGGGGAWQEKK